ncbi:MAG: 4-hydroxy-tetrahydrodipicolinate reductase [Candidatus Daviesbacteria bacterium]|nr:4-hydroxy-tetrahydrodipicolinate reductase [Candidatus Daviesbacteria bacterium]
MKIALIGYGNMGHEVENLVKESGTHQVVSVSYENSGDSLDKEGIAKADVVIDFTSSEIVVDTIKEVAGMGKNMVVGTTGWYDQMDKAKEVVEKANTGFIYAQNFSIGANIFFKVVGFASSMFSKFGDYDVAGFEIHHSGKKDSPSGTAKKMAQVIMENFPQKKVLKTGRLDRQIKSKELHFASLRIGRNPGFHEVIFDSVADEIKLSHSAHGRRGFAEGAIVAAEFIKNKKGFYTFDEVFKNAKV